jgi:hypothetical protein
VFLRVIFGVFVDDLGHLCIMGKMSDNANLSIIMLERQAVRL